MLSPDDLNRYERMLRERATAITAERDHLGESSRIVDLDQQVTGRLTRMDALQQQQMALESKRRLERERIRIAAALDRIAGGTYGICAQCGAAIATDRLDVAPESPFCQPCFKALP